MYIYADLNICGDCALLIMTKGLVGGKKSSNDYDQPALCLALRGG